jgi:hypothetical protein
MYRQPLLIVAHMMVTTHVLAGLALAAGATTVAPELGTLPVVAAAAGGLAPDLDVAGDHRRTLHFPAYGTVAVVPALALALVVPGPLTAALALFVVAAALHAVSDALGSGLELRPWEATSDRAVYDHLRGRWLPPRRWVRYDGAPEDVLVGAALAVPSLIVFDGAVETAVLAALAVSVAYALVRKSLPTIAERGVERLPDDLRDPVARWVLDE